MFRFSAWSGRRALVAVVAATALVSVAGTYAVASAGDARSPADQNRTSSAPVAQAVGTTTQGTCKMAFDTEVGVLVPPDDTTANNPAAGSVTFKKQCVGAVVARFVGEVSTPAASDFIHMDIRATCVGTGGVTAPCTVGQQVFGQPGHTFVQSGPTSTGTRSLQELFANLPRGLWRFDALPGGNGTAFLDFRSLTVEAYTGG